MTSTPIRRLSGPEEARHCASIMASSDPWLKLGRGFDGCLSVIGDPEREVWLAAEGDAVRGFIVLNLHAGPVTGYIQSVCVAREARGKGLGTELVHFAEKRIFAQSPNVFLCVSSFNPKARALYERLGYETVGELRDYIVRGHSEILMRKSISPIRDFNPAKSL
jgi:ribosomal protein S18 acetylase RimI-like enzyme